MFDYLDLYLDHLYASDLNTNTSIPQYKRTLCDFLNFISNLGVGSVTEIKTTHLDKYQAYLKKINKSASIRKKFSIIKQFFKYLHSRKYILDNPTEVIGKIRVKDSEQKKKDILSLKESQLLLKSVEKYSYKKTKLRNKIIFMIFLFCALRVSELSCLKKTDIDLKKRTIYIWSGKGEKNREVPIDDELSKHIKLYFQNRSTDNPYLFPGQKPNSHLSQKAIFKLVVHYVKKAKFEKSITPHSLRRIAATLHRLNGVDVRTIQILLGHSSINTTMIYLNEDVEIMKKEIRGKNKLFKNNSLSV